MSVPHRVWSRRAALTGMAAATTAATLPATAAGRTPTSGDTANGRLYEIRSGRHRVIVAGVAATLLSWRVDGAEMLLTHPAEEVGEGYQGKTILPWPNRIDHGRYTFGGQRLQVPINEPSRQAALHGLMSFVEWLPVRHRADSVVLQYPLPPQYGYPFHTAYRIEFTLTEEGPRMTLSARNSGTTPAPFGMANHAYLAAASPKIDPIVLRVPASTYYRTNDRLIPIGTSPVRGTKYDFRSPRRVGSTTMDTAFTDLARGSDGKAVVRLDRPGGPNVELWVDETHRYLQVYTDDQPDTERPPRQGIAVEPMTCAPNAFVTGDGLITLAPGETHQGSWGYRITD